MKTNYIKSISLILLGCILTLVISSLLNSEPNEETSKQLETKTTTKRELKTSNTVPLETAAEGVAMYKLWLKYLPDSIHLEGSTLIFKNVVIPSNEVELVSCMIDTIKKNLNIEGSKIPFSPTNSRDYAYFIQKEDIHDALNSVENATGIRVYTAPKGLSSNKSSEVSTHIYVVPTVAGANNTNNDYIPGEENKYVFDLTSPCPASCGNNNLLNDFPLECPNS